MKKQKLFIGILIFVSFLIFVKQSDKTFHWLKSEEIRKPVVFSDGTGYYAYLPQVFIYQEKGFVFIDSLTKTYKNYTFNHCLTRTEKHDYFDKYFIGTALCMSPFFLTAHGITKITGGKLDGYSYLYQLFIALSTFSFWLVACIFLFKTLKLFEIPNWISLTSLALITFATNLNYYVVFEPSLSHIYSFAAIAAWIYYSQKYVLFNNQKHFIILCVILTLIILIRPVNGIILVLFPFFFKSFSNFKNWLVDFFSNHKKILTLGLVIFISGIILQYVNVYLQIGEARFNIYMDEKFDYIWSPKIFEILFSYRKGLFIYTPFLIIPLFGLVALFKIDRLLAMGFALFLALFTYITASWWCWYYGGSLGMRPFVDIYAVFVILFALLLNRLSYKRILIIGSLSVAIIWYNLLLLYQYDHAIIHYSEMNETKFKKVFTKTDRRFEWCFYRSYPQNHYPNWEKQKIKAPTSFVLKENIEKRLGYIPNDSIYARQGITVKFNAKITEDTGPTITLYGIKKGQHHSLDQRIYGWLLDELNTFYPIEMYFPSTKYDQYMDTIYFLFSGQQGQTIIKDLTITKSTEKKN